MSLSWMESTPRLRAVKYTPKQPTRLHSIISGTSFLQNRRVRLSWVQRPINSTFIERSQRLVDEGGKILCLQSWLFESRGCCIWRVVSGSALQGRFLLEQYFRSTTCWYLRWSWAFSRHRRFHLLRGFSYVYPCSLTTISKQTLAQEEEARNEKLLFGVSLSR